MPEKYNPTAEEEGLYGSSESPVSPPEESGMETETTEAETTDEMESVSKSAVVPNGVLTGPDGTSPKEGDEIVVKVVKNFGDESEIVYAPAKPESETETGSYDQEIEALDQEG